MLAGCATPPAKPKALDTLYSAYESNRLHRFINNRAYLELARTNAPTRNDMMNDLILMINQNYGKIERSLYGHKSWADFGGSVLSIGLGTAGTLAGGEGVKTTLSALVTAIDSTKTSFNKDILQGQSMIAITATMRKLRAEKLLQIRYSQKLSISAYPLSLGLDDLMEYYQAGTFVGALQSMTEDAAAVKKAADEKLTAFKTAGAVTKPTTHDVAAPADGAAPSANADLKKVAPTPTDTVIESIH